MLPLAGLRKSLFRETSLFLLVATLMARFQVKSFALMMSPSRENSKPLFCELPRLLMVLAKPVFPGNSALNKRSLVFFT
ncbi:hypothetical protein D3C87_1766560 [compost metagenome]